MTNHESMKQRQIVTQAEFDRMLSPLMKQMPVSWRSSVQEMIAQAEVDLAISLVCDYLTASTAPGVSTELRDWIVAEAKGMNLEPKTWLAFLQR